MAIVRLRELGPQESTVAASTHQSSTVLYTFLKSTASTQDRAVAMREFLRSQSRASGVAHGGGGGALLASSNAKLVSLCEEVVLDRLLLGSMHLQHDQMFLAAAQRQERSPSLAMEKGFWKRFLTAAASSSRVGASDVADGPHGAALKSDTEIVPIRTRRRPQARKDTTATTLDSATAAEARSETLDGGVDGKRGSALATAALAVSAGSSVAASVTEMPATSDFIRASPATVERKARASSEPRSTSAPITSLSPAAHAGPASAIEDSSQRRAESHAERQLVAPLPAVRIDHSASPQPSGGRHPRERSQSALPSLLARAVGSLCERLDADPDASDPADEATERDRSRLRRMLVDVRTRVASSIELSQRRLMLLHPRRASASSSLSQSAAFLDELSTRIDNIEALLRVEEHEQDTLNLTANALRLENAALTRMLRSVLAIMMRHELRLDNAVMVGRTGLGVSDDSKSSEGEQALLTELRNILDDASAEE